MKRIMVVASSGMLLATALLVLLKLVGLVNWCWWTVTVPMWGPWLATVIAAFCLGIHLLLVRLERRAL